MNDESRTDMLINRIAANEEHAGEFAEFEAAASGEDWQRLARSLRDELQMRAALGEALAGECASEIERARERCEAANGGRRLFAHSGWAAAAVIAIAWTLTIVVPGTGAMPVPPDSGMASTPSAVHRVSLTADEAIEQYLRAGESEGRLIAELPTVLLESQLDGDGQLEVYFVRQFLERERVGRVYELAEDEHGAYVPVQVNPAALLSSPSSL